MKFKDKVHYTLKLKAFTIFIMNKKAIYKSETAFLRPMVQVLRLERFVTLLSWGPSEDVPIRPWPARSIDGQVTIWSFFGLLLTSHSKAECSP